MANVVSPCIGICRINIQSGLCEGCLRTRDEIAAWIDMRDDQRRQVVLVLEQRQVQSASFD